MRNVELTCHNAGGAIETWMGFEELAMRNVDAVLSGKEPLTPVNMHLMIPENYTGYAEHTGLVDKVDLDVETRFEEMKLDEAIEIEDDSKLYVKEVRVNGWAR